MTLQAAIDAELPFLRAEAEGMMVDTLTAFAPSGTTMDGEGFEVPAYTDMGDTPGRFTGLSRARDGAARTLTIGSVERVILDDGLHIPITALVPEAGFYGFGWEYVVTAVGASTDPALLDSRWLVVDAPSKSNATARRLSVARVA